MTTPVSFSKIGQCINLKSLKFTQFMNELIVIYFKLVNNNKHFLKKFEL